MRPVPADPADVAIYVSHLATSGRAWSTISRALASISVMHRAMGLSSPRGDAGLANVVKGIRRTIGVAPKHAKSALLATDLRRIVLAMPDWTIAVRDKALLLVGWTGAFRRSELVALDVESIALEEQGYVMHIGRSKRDQEGVGRIVGIPRSGSETCPVRALGAWLTRAGIRTGPLFRPVDCAGHIGPKRLTGRAVARIVKRWTGRDGFDPASMAGHSLRSGFATSAAAAGASERAIMEQTGHKSVQIVRRYIRRGTVWHDCAARGLV